MLWLISPLCMAWPPTTHQRLQDQHTEYPLTVVHCARF